MEYISKAKKQTVINVKVQCMIKSITKIHYTERKEVRSSCQTNIKIIPNRLKKKNLNTKK